MGALRVLLSLAAFFACVALVHADASIPAETMHASPISSADIGNDGRIIDPVANPVLVPQPRADPAAAAKKPKKEYYGKPKDFLGKSAGVPMNPTRHLQRVLQEDKKYIASILRAPLDFGDPDTCQHSDIEKDKLALKRIALRINHRRIALRQQQQWIDQSSDGLRSLEQEIQTTTSTARNLAEQIDALQQQRQDIANHVRRAMLLKELDQTSANLMRLKNGRMAEEIRLQKKQNGFAVQNRKHNQILKKLHRMRTVGGRPLGYLNDPKPYRFSQVDAGAESEAETESTDALENQSKTEAVEATSPSSSSPVNPTQTEDEHITMLENEATQELAAHETVLQNIKEETPSLAVASEADAQESSKQ